MRPRPEDEVVRIPLTFDVFRGGSIDDSGRGVWLSVVAIIWLALTTLLIIYAEGWGKLLFSLLTTYIAIQICRFVIMREIYFKKRRAELVENNYTFDHNIFWDIYDIGELYPYFCRFRNGDTGLFIIFDKDVTVGKGDNDNFYHHEAITNAYQQMVSRNIQCVHIDYMDIVGRDTRMDSLFEVARDIENPELKRVMNRIYSNIQYIMNKSYASYDVYCFTYRGPDDIFWDELQAVLKQFQSANFIRYRMLKKDDIGLLAQVLNNVTSFSANRACEDIFKETNNTEFLTVIWVERGGEKKIINKTREEKAEARRVAESERRVKKNRKRKLFGKKKEVEDDIDLF